MVAESTPAQVISQLVAGNRAKPRFERLRLVPGVTLQMHGQQSLLNNILTIGRTSPRRCQAPSDDVPQPKRNKAEKPPIGLVVPCLANRIIAERAFKPANEVGL